MRKTISSIGVLTLLAWLALLVHGYGEQTAPVLPSPPAPAQPAGPPPQAVFPEIQYNFEPVMEGQAVQHDFLIENKGQGELLITSVKPD